MDTSNLNPTWENMRAGIEAQIPLVRDMPHHSYRQVRDKLGDVTLPTRIYLVGCGDSWSCGLATRLAFEQWAGVATEPLQAMEFSRYLVNYAPPGSLVVATSVTGKTSRTIECVRRAQNRDLKTIALTANLDSPIAREAETVLELAYPERSFAPGTSSYIDSLLMLYVLALFLGELSGHLSSSDSRDKMDRITSLAEPMRQTLDAAEEPVEQLARRIPFDAEISFMGAGPNYGTARFAMAKVIEATLHNTSSQQLEEWAHEGFFFTRSGTYVFVLAATGAGLDRAREQLAAVKSMGAHAVAVCDAEDHETQALADTTLPVFGDPEEILSPLLYCLSAELFALQFAIAKKKTLLGFDDDHWVEVNFPQIYDSQIKS